MSLYDMPIHTLDGEETTLGQYAGTAILAVNVASKCGLTPQYEGLEKLHETYAERGILPPANGAHPRRTGPSPCPRGPYA